jgi:uncharacterized protein (DUF885 family)
MHRFSLLLAVLLASCATSPQTGSVNMNDGDSELRELADGYLAGYLAWRPQIGTGLGLHEYDGKVTDYGRASIRAELARLNSFDRRLEALGSRNLSATARYDYRILRGAVQREIFGFEDMQLYRRNPMTYAGALDVSIYIKRNFAPLEARVRSMIAILDHAPDIVAAGRANLVEALPRPQVETAIEVGTGAADFLANDVVQGLKGLQDETLQAKFNVANQRAIGELRGFVTWLKQEKLPKASNAYALGRERYVRLLRYGEMITLTPEQILAIGLRELRREQQVFADTARTIDPNKPAIDVFKEIQRNHPTEQSLIPDTRKDLEAIRRFVVDHRIVTLPSEVRARVEETPQFMRATSFASMDTPGPFETKATEAYYYVTPVEADWPARQKDEWLTAFNYYTTDIVSVHEVYPGHYTQFLCLNASPATRLEKIFTSYAFVEGWAHYTEQMLVDEGFGRSGAEASDPAARLQAARYRLAQSDEALLRLCRLCVSIRMHCQGMTVEEAARFFQDNCYYQEKPARAEAMRGTFDPEYLYYTVGKLEILKLREEYRRQEGGAFSLQKFHDELLRHGAPPLRLLREWLLKDSRLWDQTL